MAGTLAHRGPDDQGTWTDAAAGFALGFRRLSIIDLSPAGHQPMVSASGRYVVAFNGEIYNHRDLRKELETDGASFRGRSDTEVLLAAVERWGMAGAVERLWGMFAVALWDTVDRCLWLARDRLGKKPLYYCWARDTFLFGSELKALRAHPAFAAQVSGPALASYLRFGYVPGPHTIYERVFKLPPATYARIQPHRDPEVVRYWDLRTLAQTPPVDQPDQQAIDELDALLRDATERRMVADVPLGAFLSGGIDSASVVALMQQVSTQPVRTFTIGFADADYDESPYARAVAAHLATDHTELRVTATEATAVIPRLPAIYDEPFADSSQIPTFLVSELARRHVTVALSGDGGDEVFAGYNRYLWAPRVLQTTERLPGPVRVAAARAVALLAPDVWDSLSRVVPARLRPRTFGDKLYKARAALLAPTPLGMYKCLVSQWDPPPVAGGEARSGLDDRSNWLPDGFVQQMRLLDTITYLPDDILAKVDRATMAVSLEARAPLLDHRVVEWAWRQPIERHIRGGQGKRMLRQVLHRYAPAPLFERPKVGFGVPIHAWIRGPLREWADDLLSESRLRDGRLDPRPVREAWTAHLSQRENRQHELWTILMWQAWRQSVGA